MRILIATIAALGLSACASRGAYQDQLAFVQQQLQAQREDAAAREERLSQRQADCADKVDAGAISACMLGATALTLADGRAGTAQQQIIMPPAPPKSTLQAAGDFLLGFAKVAAPVVLGIRQSDNATELGIAEGAQLFGFLGRNADAQAAFAGQALGSVERVATNAVNATADVAINSVDAMADTSNAWAETAPELAPDITITGTGNSVGDNNTLTLDQSQQGRDRIAEGADNLVEIDQSQVDGDRLHQEGENNRQGSPGPFNYDQQFTCTLTSNAAPGGNGGTGVGSGGGAGAQGAGILTCAPGNG